MWSKYTGAHQPNESLVNICNSEGNFDYPGHDILKPQNYKVGYIKHFTVKTAEEFALKLIRGEQKDAKLNYNQLNERIERFFRHNKFTKKIGSYGKSLNMSF